MRTMEMTPKNPLSVLQKFLSVMVLAGIFTLFPPTGIYSAYAQVPCPDDPCEPGEICNNSGAIPFCEEDPMWNGGGGDGGGGDNGGGNVDGGGETTPMADVLCDVVDWFHGNLGRGLATLAVITIGVGAMLGKTSWGMALTVAVGISVIFGAEELVRLLGIIGEGCFTEVG